MEIKNIKSFLGRSKINLDIQHKDVHVLVINLMQVEIMINLCKWVHQNLLL